MSNDEIGWETRQKFVMENKVFWLGLILVVTVLVVFVLMGQIQNLGARVTALESQSAEGS